MEERSRKRRIALTVNHISLCFQHLYSVWDILPEKEEYSVVKQQFRY
jgi:hypothetical protein